MQQLTGAPLMSEFCLLLSSIVMKPNFRTKKKLLRADWFLPRVGCFCFALRTCVAVFSWCFATASFGCIILSIIFSARAFELDKDTFVNADDVEPKKKELWMLTGSLLLYGLVSLPLGVLMLQGALQGRRVLMVPWICGAGLTIVSVSAMLFLMRSILRWKLILTVLVALGVLLFAWIHVFSLFYRTRPRRYSIQFPMETGGNNFEVKIAKNPICYIQRASSWPSCTEILQEKRSGLPFLFTISQEKISSLRTVNIPNQPLLVRHYTSQEQQKH